MTLRGLCIVFAIIAQVTTSVFDSALAPSPSTIDVNVPDFGAVGDGAADIVIMLRQDIEGNWAHVLIRHIDMDLDRTPDLSWRFQDNGLNAPGYAVKVIDAATANAFILTETNQPPFFDYQAYDLRRLFEIESGSRKIHVKFHFLGLAVVTPEQILKAKRGDFWAMDFLRLEGAASTVTAP